jgi:DNA-binding transcriptional regulator YhcF (GntR family)
MKSRKHNHSHSKMRPLIPQQPKNPDDQIYQLISEFLNPGDQKVFAVDLNVNPNTVSKVVNGFTRSERIWNHVMKVVLKRKEQKDQFIQYMTSK